MSMISAQIDELRELAGDGSMEWVTGPIRASVLRDAADTIWELRDDLQRANVENAKLREYIERKQHLQDFARLVDENSKLRELVRELWEYVKGYADSLDAEVQGYSWPTNTHGYGDKVRNGLGAFVGFPDRMRELGVAE